MGKKGFIVCLIVICMAYGLTIFFYEREKNYPEIMAVTGATPLALAEQVPEGLSLTINGMVKQPYHLSSSALRALATARIRTKEVSPGGQFQGAYIYVGIPIFNILEGIAPKKPEDLSFQRIQDLLVTVTSASEDRVTFSYGELLMADDRHPVTLAFHRRPLMPDKEPETYTKNLFLEDLEGLRLICPRDPDTSRYLDRVTGITLGVHETPDDLLPPYREKYECVTETPLCVVEEDVRPASYEGLEQWKIKDWIRMGHGRGFFSISTARGYPLREFLDKNLPGYGADHDYLLVSCAGFRALFSGPEIFLQEEGKNILMLTEVDGREAPEKVNVASLSDYFVDRDVWDLTYIVVLDRN